MKGSFANGGASNSQGPDVPAMWRKNWEFQLFVLGARTDSYGLVEGEPAS